MSSLGEFLHEQVQLPAPAEDLKRLTALAGEEIGNTFFYSSLDEAVDAIEPWMPIYFLPIGLEASFHVGIHLRPSDVQAGRLAVARGDDAELIEVANSLGDYVLLCVATLHAVVNEQGPLRAFDESVKRANRIFGDDFYVLERNGDLGRGEVETLLLTEGRGSADAYRVAALNEDDEAARIRIYEQGVEQAPGCLHLHAKLAELYHQRKADVRAANALSNALDCYHHTAYFTDLKDFARLGRRIAKAAPETVSESAQRELSASGVKDRTRFALQQADDGNVENSIKLLCDLGHDARNYGAVLDVLREHYKQLDWRWASALCTLREDD
jgi:hypothetical protein